MAAGKNPTPGIVRVKLQPEVARTVAKSPRLKSSSGKITSGVASLDNALNLISGVSIEPMLPPNPQFAAQRAKFGLDQWYVVKFDEHLLPTQVQDQLSKVAGVMCSEVVVPMSLKEGSNNVRRVTTAPVKADSKYPFNDPRLPEQWHYQNFGTQGTQMVGADINLFNAWKLGTGSGDVVVAIIDGGVDYTHEDLAANMFINEAELNGEPGVDDDKNGYVDDIYGYNFCTNSGTVYPQAHGTHVAGTVAAVNNNGIGVCGIAGGDGTPNSGVKLLSVQVFDGRTGAGDADFAKAIIYAAEMGATIAQCSWGWDQSGYKEQAVLDAIDYFTETARNKNGKMTGGLMIFATGNAGSTGEFYPAFYEKTLAVTAMTDDMRPATYSNYGEWVDIIAPGGLTDYSQSEGVLSTTTSNGYGFMAGTSMATPHVSGIAALVVSKYGNEGFTNESLRTQLETSVNDFYAREGNEQFRGLFGVGSADASKAMQMGDGSAPEPVTDIDLQASQDYIIVEWTIPASVDNNVYSHIVYYSTEPFSADSELSKVRSIVADTKFYNSGDRYSVEIKDLKPLTKYYVAIRAVNRWGQSAALSEVKEIMTNEGPEFAIDKTGLSFGSTEAQPIATTTFGIGNNADGILKWQSVTKTVSMTPSTRSLANVKPAETILESGVYNGKLGMTQMATSDSSGSVLADFETNDYPKELKYYSDYYVTIGDTDLSLPNSLAQFMWVDPAKYPDGFNLTGVTLDYTSAKNPIVQIYTGSTSIKSARLVAEVKPQTFTSLSPIALEEQIYFAANDHFWIVVHFEGGQEDYSLPLCTTDEEFDYVGNYSMMSNDLGKTWVQLRDALAGSEYEPYVKGLTWGVVARSDNPDLGEMLVLTPESGVVRKGETQNVTASVDGSKLLNGTYKFNVRLTTNDEKNAEVVLPVELKVDGNGSNVKFPTVVDFGSILVGESKTLTVEAFNEGFGLFAGSIYGASLSSYSGNIKSTSEHFIAPQSISTGFPARTRVSFDVTYTPKVAGSQTGTIVFKDKNGVEVTLVVRGVATEPSKLAIEPATVDAGTLTVGEEAKTVKFSVKNEGNYPLEYVFPKFSDETIEGITSQLHQFGYNVSSNIATYKPGFEYDGNPELIGAVDITSQFSDNVDVSSPIKLGFSFPYYGKTYDEVYVTPMGAVCFAPNQYGFHEPLDHLARSVKNIGMIVAYGRRFSIAGNSKIEYAKQDGKFVVSYKDVLAVNYGGGFTPVSMRIALSANGDIEFFYDDYTANDLVKNNSDMFCGLCDFNVEDPVLVTDIEIAKWTPQGFMKNYEETEENQRYSKFNSGTCLKFSAPFGQFVESIDKPYGVIPPAQSFEISAIVKADETLEAGESFNDLVIVTNDPNPAVSAVRINAVIAGDCFEAAASLAETEIDLGDNYRTSEIKTPVTVRNTGNDKLTVSSVTIEGEGLSSDIEAPFVLEPRMSKDINVVVNTEQTRKIEGKVSVETSKGNLEASIKANIIGCPTIDMSFTEINETVESGAELHKDLEVANNGDEPLVYSIIPNTSADLTIPENENSSVDYVYAYSGEDEFVDFDWVDVVDNGLGTHTPVTSYLLNDWIEVDLPFEFSFYGKKYKKMWVYGVGFVTFNEPEKSMLWPEPSFPDGTVYNNLIAPYWGVHSPAENKTSGTYHYCTEDRVVVSFMEYLNTMNRGVCYQLIMEKDGSIKFQYKAHGDDAMKQGNYGIACVINDQFEGVKMRDYMIAFGTATKFTPVVEKTLNPGQKETIGFDFKTNMMAGTYNYEYNVNSNVPSKEEVKIPVTLNITGKATPVFPTDTIKVEHPIGFKTSDKTTPIVKQGAAYEILFTVENNGTKEFTIDEVTIDGPTSTDPFFGVVSQVFALYFEAPTYNYYTGTWSENKTWQRYSTGRSYPVGQEGMNFSVPMFSHYTSYNATGTYDVKLTIKYTDDEGQKTADVNVQFVVTPAPKATLDKEEIRFTAEADDAVMTELVKLTNSGEYKLNYDLVLDPSGIGDESANDDNTGDGGISGPDGPGGGGGGGIVVPFSEKMAQLSNVDFGDVKKSKMKVKAQPYEDVTNEYDGPSNFEFNRALFYSSYGNSPAYNYGALNSYSEYKAATTFTAPADGFNISHIYMPVTIEDTKNITVKIDVVQGDDPVGENVLGRGKVLIEEQEDPKNGKFFVIELEKPVYLNPNEVFTVVATYGAGPIYPAYLVKKEDEVVPNRYRGYIEDYGWFDVAELFEEKYGSLGYVISCLETKEGQPWIRLLSAESGVVEAGASSEFKIEVNAAAARMEKNNKAMLVIKSTDPAKQVVNFPIYLDCNARPVITVPSGIIAVNEGETTNVPVIVNELDGDEYTVTISDNKGFAKVASYEVTEGDAAVVTEDNGVYKVSGATQPVTFNVGITADYQTASIGNMLTVEAVDSKNHRAEATARYDIAFVNRAPEAVETEEVKVNVGAVSDIITFDSLFTDPEGEEMTYEFNMRENRYVDPYTTPTGVIFNGKMKGSVRATVTATDKYGASTNNVITVVVDDFNSINGIDAEGDGALTIKQNPVIDWLNAECGFSATEAVFTLYDAAGAVVARQERAVANGEVMSMNISDLATGVYLLTAEYDGNRVAARVVKR